MRRIRPPSLRALRMRSAVPATIARVALMQVVFVGLAQGPGSVPAHPNEADVQTVAIHYEDQLSTESSSVTIFFPRPAGDDWQVLEPVSDDPCLQVGRVSGGEPGQVLVIEADVRAPAAPADPAAGASARVSGDDVRVSRCHANLTLTFASSTQRWAATAEVVVNRIDATPMPYTDLNAVMTSDFIEVPRLGAARPAEPATLLTLTLRNPFDHAITVRGVTDPETFEDVVGTVHPHDPASFDGTYATLETITMPNDDVTVEAGTEIAFALLLDPDRRLADGSGTLTIRPALIVERGGTTFASPFPRVSAAWGNDLP